MTQPLVTVQPENSLWSVHEQMQRIHVRRLVVVQPSGDLVGIVTQTQMLRMMDPVEIYQVMQQLQTTIAQQSEDLQRLNQELLIANRELRSLATIDELTQVANRRYFNQFLKQVWQRDSISQQSIALLVLDIDHFKAYNDTYGHVMGGSMPLADCPGVAGDDSATAGFAGAVWGRGICDCLAGNRYGGCRKPRSIDPPPLHQNQNP